MRTVAGIALAVVVALPLRAQARPQGPVGQWSVVLQLPGMGRAVDTAATAARRRALIRRLGRGTALIPAAHERDLERDYIQDNDFRQNNTFFYFTELETQDAWLLLSAATPDSVETVLFLPPRKPSQERWTGLRLGPDSTAARLSGIARVLPTDSLQSVLAERRWSRLGAGPLYLSLEDAKQILDSVFRPRLGLSAFDLDVRNLSPIVDSMRLVKDDDELVRLRTAVAVSVQGHLAAMQAARPGMYEYEIEAVLEAAFRRNGADRVGYPSIVGSGPNSTTLHYDVNRRQTQNGDLVVVDAAAEWGQYTADVTRTFPVNGKFTPRQKAIYDLVLATQRAAFDSTRPGVTIGQLNRIARTYMHDHSGTLCGEQTCDVYFIHGLSHWLGMDVHDAGDYSTPLKPGMVFTIEPGIYLPEESLGVRIEDDVLVTATAAEWLSDGAPRTTEEIEHLMRGRR